MEKHHQVLVHDEAVEAAVRLSHRYIPARQLPDKAVSLLDTACARVAIGLHAIPPQVDDSRKRIEALETELGIVEREARLGEPVAERRARVEALLAAERDRLAGLEQAWQDEKALVDEVLELRGALAESGVGAADGESAKGEPDGAADGAPDEVDLAALQQTLRSKLDDLAALQGESPLIMPGVDAQAVANVVADWTGIPVGRMIKDEVATVLNLADAIAGRVVGQRHAHEMIAKRIHTARAGLDNPGKPIGVFMLAGPSGVGKTETALALAETLYGGEQNVITINMSEFQEAHTVSTLKGAPPGYVGYGEGGVLTEAVRRKPYSVVLLDEVEKAHPDVHEIFFQVFDKGVMEDGEGRLIDFKNTLILLTTNVGSDLIMNLCKDPELMPDPDGIAKALRKPLLEVFPAALLGRIVTIPFYPLSAEMVGSIARLQLDRISRRLHANHGMPLEYDDEVVALIARRCTEVESGGRMIDNILTNSLLPRISQEFLSRLLSGEAVAAVRIGVAGDDFAYQFDVHGDG
jgi:type VI secretion system protein VasG